MFKGDYGFLLPGRYIKPTAEEFIEAVLVLADEMLKLD